MFDPEGDAQRTHDGRSLGGLFVAFEGGDGAGKSTQVPLLVDWLRDLGHDVVQTREPGDSSIGPAVRDLLLHSADGALSERAEALLYAADRAQHVATVVRPALAEGSVVVTDRYVDSSIAYQAVGRGLPAAEIEALSRWATQWLVPDLTVLLDVSPGVGLGRFSGPADRLEREPAQFHGRVRQAFLDLAARAPEHYLVLDATLPVDDLATRVRERVSPLLPTIVGHNPASRS